MTKVSTPPGSVAALVPARPLTFQSNRWHAHTQQRELMGERSPDSNPKKQIGACARARVCEWIPPRPAGGR